MEGTTDTRFTKNFDTLLQTRYIHLLTTQLNYGPAFWLLYLMSSTEAAVNAAEEGSSASSSVASVQTSPTLERRPQPPTSIEVTTRPQRTVSKGSSTSSKPSVSSAPPLSSSSVEFSSVSTSAEAGEASGYSNSSRMSTSSSLGLSAQGEAAPPLGAKTEEVVRGIAFKVSTT